MTQIYFWLFVLLTAVAVGSALWKPARMFEYPAFMGFAFAAFILPQAVSLVRFPGGVEVPSVQAMFLMTCLCLGAVLLGYQLRPSPMIVQVTSRAMDLPKLFHVGIFFVAISFVFQRALGSTEVEFATTGGMTGRGTILLFFQQLCYPGFAICLFCAVRRPTILNVLASVAGLVPLLEAVVIGRREGTAQVALIILMAFFFERKWVPPRWLFAAALVGSLLLIPATGTYRQLAGEKGVLALREIDFLDNFKRYVTEESPILELRNGAAVIEATRSTGHYEYGAGYWNHLVFRFVPAQLLGKGFKDSLKVRHAWDLSEEGMTETGFELSQGSTVTGLGDTYQQFGWFGCLFFVFMAVIFKSLWRAAQNSDGMLAKLLYVLSCTSGMRAVTHWTLDFLPGLLYFVIFLGVAMLYAAAPKRVPLRPRPDRSTGKKQLTFTQSKPRASTEPALKQEGGKR